MNSLKHILNKKGSYLIEATISLPAFIIAVCALALVIDIISICEGISFATVREVRDIDLFSYQVKTINPFEKKYLENSILDSNERLTDFEVTKFKYLFKSGELDDLIAVNLEANFTVLNPIGIGGKITFTEGLLSRGFTGKNNESNTLTVQEFEDNSNSTVVIIFPRYGERYHKYNCTYVTRYDTNEFQMEMEKEDAKRKGYTPCKVCFLGKDNE